MALFQSVSEAEHVRPVRFKKTVSMNQLTEDELLNLDQSHEGRTVFDKIQVENRTFTSDLEVIEYQVIPGNYTIRITNESVGIDTTSKITADIVVVETGERDSNDVLPKSGGNKYWQTTIPAYSLDKKHDGLKELCIKITLKGKKGMKAKITLKQDYAEIHHEHFNMSTDARKMRRKIDGTGMYVVRVESLDPKDIAPWSCALMCEGIFKTSREACTGTQTFEPFIIYSDQVNSEVVLEVRRDAGALFNLKPGKRKRARKGSWKFSIIKVIGSDWIEKIEERDNKELMGHFNILLERARTKKDIKTVEAILKACDSSMEFIINKAKSIQSELYEEDEYRKDILDILQSHNQIVDIDKQLYTLINRASKYPDLEYILEDAQDLFKTIMAKKELINNIRSKLGAQYDSVRSWGENGGSEKEKATHQNERAALLAQAAIYPDLRSDFYFLLQMWYDIEDPKNHYNMEKLKLCGYQCLLFIKFILKSKTELDWKTFSEDEARVVSKRDETRTIFIKRVTLELGEEDVSLASNLLNYFLKNIRYLIKKLQIALENGAQMSQLIINRDVQELKYFLDPLNMKDLTPTDRKRGEQILERMRKLQNFDEFLTETEKTLIKPLSISVTSPFSRIDSLRETPVSSPKPDLKDEKTETTLAETQTSDTTIAETQTTQTTQKTDPEKKETVKKPPLEFASKSILPIRVQALTNEKMSAVLKNIVKNIKDYFIAKRKEDPSLEFSKIGTESHPGMAIGDYIRKQFLPFLEAVFTGGLINPKTQPWDFIEEVAKSGAKIPVDQVNSAIQMKDLVEQTESNLKAVKFRTFWCMVINSKDLVTVFKAVTGSDLILIKFYSEENVLMKPKRKLKLLHYLQQLGMLPLNLDVTVARNEYTLSDYF